MVEAFQTKLIERKDGLDMLEPVYLTIEYPTSCPFRYDEKCTLCIETDSLKGCNVSFMFPTDCPLNLSDIIVRKNDNPKQHNSETSPKTRKTH